MTVIAGRYRYAPRLYVDYLSERRPDWFVATKVPTDEQRGGRPLVTIHMTPAPAVPGNASLVLARRWLLFACFPGELGPGESGELAGGELAEDVRAEVKASRYARVCRLVNTIGEPARFDLDDQPIPRFQLTMEVWLREAYARPDGRPMLTVVS